MTRLSLVLALEPEVGHKDHYRRLGVYPAATSEQIFHAVENLCTQYHSRKGGLRKPIREFLESGEVLLNAGSRKNFDQEAGHKNSADTYENQSSYADRLRSLRLKLGSLEDGLSVELIQDPDLSTLQMGRPAAPERTPSTPSRVPEFVRSESRSLFKMVPKSSILLFKRTDAEALESKSQPERATPELKNYLQYLNSIFHQAFENGTPSKAFLRFMEGVLSRLRKEIFFLPSRKSRPYLQTRGEFLTYLKKLRAHTHDEAETHAKPKIRALVNDLLLFDLWMMGFGKYLESPPKKKKLRAQEEPRYQAAEDSSLRVYRIAYRNFLTPEMIAVELGLQDPEFAKGLVYRAAQLEVLGVLEWFQKDPQYWRTRVREVLEALQELNTSKVQFEDVIQNLKRLEITLQSQAGAQSLGSKCLRPLVQMGRVLKIMIKSSSN